MMIMKKMMNMNKMEMKRISSVKKNSMEIKTLKMTMGIMLMKKKKMITSKNSRINFYKDDKKEKKLKKVLLCYKTG